MSKVLFLGHVVPFPSNSGQRVRNSTILQALALEGHKVTFICLLNEDQPVGEELYQLCENVELIRPRKYRGENQYMQRLLFLLSMLPYGIHRFRNIDVLNAICKYTNRVIYDVVICDDIYNAANIPKDLTIPVLLNKHDITHEKYRRFLTQERNPFKLAYGWTEYFKVRRWELLTCSKFSCVMAVSNRDKELLIPMCSNVPITIVPNIIDVAQYVPTYQSQDKRVLFVGAMDWYPNRDAVEYFVYSILPSLRKKLPGVQFIVAGRDPSESFRKQFAAMADVEFTGTVLDMRQEIARAAVCVVPLRIGSGTRLKILEAAAMGKVTVSTYIGAEGLNFIDGEDIIREDDPAKFAQSIEDLILNDGLRIEMGRKARKRVEEQYSMPVLRKSLNHSISLVSTKDY